LEDPHTKGDNLVGVGLVRHDGVTPKRITSNGLVAQGAVVLSHMGRGDWSTWLSLPKMTTVAARVPATWEQFRSQRDNVRLAAPGTNVRRCHTTKVVARKRAGVNGRARKLNRNKRAVGSGVRLFGQGGIMRERPFNVARSERDSANGRARRTSCGTRRASYCLVISMHFQ
jgi:hypothetical protein